MAYSSVLLRRQVVKHHKEEIKSREQGVWEIDVLGDADGMVVGAIQRVSCCQHAAPSIEGHLYSCFRYGHGLLLHYLQSRSA